MSEVIRTMIVAGAFIWAPCVIGAICWAARAALRAEEAERRGRRILHSVQNDRREARG